MSYQGDILLGETLDFTFTTRRFSTGAPYTLAGTPSLCVYVDNSDTQITAGITLTVDFDSKTGLNHVRIVASGANGYSRETNCSVVIAAGTVDSVSVANETIATFSIENRSAIEGAITGSVSDAGAAVGDFDCSSNLSNTADIYNGLFLVFTSGTLKGIGRLISDWTTGRNAQFTGSDGTLDEPFPAAPANGDRFMIIGRGDA